MVDEVVVVVVVVLVVLVVVVVVVVVEVVLVVVVVVTACGQSHSGGHSGFSQSHGGGVVFGGQSHSLGQSGLSQSQTGGAGVVTIDTEVVGTQSGVSHSSLLSHSGAPSHSGGGLSLLHSVHSQGLISRSSPGHGFGHSHFLTRTWKQFGTEPPTQSDQPHHSDQSQLPS